MKWHVSPSFLGLLVALAAVALYLPTLGYDFAYDSVVQIQNDDFIHQPRHFADLLSFRVLGMDVLDFNRPVNLFTLLVDAVFWDRNPAGYRLTQLLLHGASAALLFRWLRLLTGQVGPALLGALFFAVHPLQCETVVEVGYREDLLATLFLLAGLNAAFAFRPGEKGKTWAPALLAVASFFLAAASKETGIAGPVVLATFWGLFRRDNPKIQRAWLLLVTTTTLAVGTFYALRFALEPKPSLIFTQPAQPIALGVDWLLVQSRIWSADFLRILWPAHLCADYGPYNLRNIPPAWALIGFLFTIILWAFGSARNRKFALATVLFWAALLPVANWVPIYCPMADRYLYLPLTGVALWLALFLGGLRHGAMRVIGFGAVLSGIAALSLVTFHQQSVWKDTASLWRAVAQENPGSLNAWLGQGDACLDRGQPGAALPYFQHAALLAQEKKAEPFAGMAVAYDALGQPRQAAEALACATKLDSRYARPETLVRALALPVDQAQRLTTLSIRAREP
ncbi:MAG: hypothetical protein NTZ46_11125 [Verrucomicrobia bacterium]|nr:hypothetical protein [Verrucomicrobiota bacterium]